MKVLIFDSGPLINLSMNGLLPALEEMKKRFDGKFIITEAVKNEVVDRPSGIERFELGALRVQNLLDKGVLELPSSLGIELGNLKNKTRELMNLANNSIKVKNRPINIVSEAEITCIALSNELNKKGINNMIAIDERTTRILGEEPENLERIMSEKLNQKISVDQKSLKSFKDHKFIRSSELVYVAYKKGLINIGGGKRLLEALIYATKFKGSSISFDEINELKKL